MFSSWFASETPTRFTSASELRDINTKIKQIHAQEKALKNAAASAGTGTSADLKHKVFEELVKSVDEHIADFNKLEMPSDEEVRFREMRELVIKLQNTIKYAHDHHNSLLYEQRSSIKQVVNTAASVGTFAAPVAAGILMPATVLGSVAGGFVGVHVGARASDAVSRGRRTTYSIELLSETSLLLRRVYESLAFKLTDKERDQERKEVDGGRHIKQKRR